MTGFIDLAGQVFGRLTVLQHYGKNEKGAHVWLCYCECGNTTIARGDALRYGMTRSCGCLAHEVRVAIGKRPKGPSPRFIDLAGKTFGYLSVLERGENSPRGQSRWRCRCVCGRETLVATPKLRSGRTISCGCMGILHATQAKIKHGDASSHGHKRLYSIWSAMKRRCYNPFCAPYKYYGGKGIKICDEWQDYQRFREWALSHGYADNLTIDRIDANGDYAPSNCQWVTFTENRSRVKRLPQDIENKVIELIKQGATGAAIIMETHVARATIARIKAKLGLARPRKRTAQKGEPWQP